MTLSVLGINHKTASVSYREQVAFNPERLQSAYESLLSLDLHNVMILSTCNRTELYFHQHSFAEIIDWFNQFLQLPERLLSQHSYRHTGNEALQHIIRVASGLDSMILGEPQILGQVKQAFVTAQSQLPLSKKFVWSIEQVFSATKKIRHDSKLGEQPVSIAFAVTKLAQQIFDDLSANTLMLVAVGEMNQLVAKNICASGVRHVIIANRSRDRAEQFAYELEVAYACNVEVVNFDQLHTLIHRADILCSCTASMDIIIDYKTVKSCIKKRRYKPLLMIDLAVPRDIDPKISKIDAIYDYSVDDLQQVLSENIEKRRTASVQAEIIVAHQVTEIVTKQRLNDVGYFIAQYQQQITNMADEMYQKAEKQLHNGEDSTQVMRKLTKQLTAKLSHMHFNLLKEAASLDDTRVLDFMVDKLSDTD